MAKHLITGVAGFVGSHLARRLLQSDHEVFGVDSLVCGFIENIKDLHFNKNLTKIRFLFCSFAFTFSIFSFAGHP